MIYFCKICETKLTVVDLPILDTYGNIIVPKMKALMITCPRCSGSMWLLPDAPHQDAPEQAVEADAKCPKCGEPEPVMHCEQCGHTFNRPT